MRWLSKFLKLPIARKLQLLKALNYMAVARYKLSRQPINDLIGELKFPPNTKVRPNDDLASEIGWALHLLSGKLPWRSDCLVSAIAARLWADRTGLPYVFHLGARHNTNQALEAHAWSTSNGQLLSGDLPDLASYKRFDLEKRGIAGLEFV